MSRMRRQSPSVVVEGTDNAIDRITCNTWETLSRRKPFRTSKHHFYGNSPSRARLGHSKRTCPQVRESLW
jgi:hypothetical protein